LARSTRFRRRLRPLPTLALLAATLAGCATLQFAGLFETGGACGGPGDFAPAAAVNARTLGTLPVNLFGRPEAGWAIYAPAVAHTVATACPADTPRFAAALARWQFDHGLTAHGAVDAPTLSLMKAGWQRARPFVRARAGGDCPDPPHDLVTLTPQESRADRPVQLRPAALAALRRMVAAARRQVPQIASDPQLLTVFSGYRDPADDAARCAVEQNCQGLVRALCSAHRTGLAVDLNLGAAPGFAADSSDDANRLWQTRSLAYRWLVANAARYGFVNYAFEPWHWEWTGESP